MQIRVVQIWGFLMTVLGWIFVACTMAMEGWKITSIGGMGGSSIIKVAWYWSSLWRSCFTDSTAVSNCYDYPVLWSVEGTIQIVRGLLMSALSLGMLGFVLSLMGMECTFIGGKDRSKYKKIYAGGWCHIIGGLLSTCGYAVYAEYVSVEYFDPDFDGLKYDLGTPLFLGWVGSAFHMTGGFFYLWSVCTPLRLRDVEAQAGSGLGFAALHTGLGLCGLHHGDGPLEGGPAWGSRGLLCGGYSLVLVRLMCLVFCSILSAADIPWSMKYRTVVMYMEIGCFVSCLCGWILVCSTLPTEYWTFSEVGSIVLTTSNYYSNLWRDCISDTTGVSDCKDYPSMLALPVSFQCSCTPAGRSPSVPSSPASLEASSHSSG